MQERLCKVTPGMRMLASPTSVIIKEIIESLVNLGAPATKKGQAILATEGSTPLILALPVVAEPSPGFI